MALPGKVRRRGLPCRKASTSAAFSPPRAWASIVSGLTRAADMASERPARCELPAGPAAQPPTRVFLRAAARAIDAVRPPPPLCNSDAETQTLQCPEHMMPRFMRESAVSLPTGLPGLCFGTSVAALGTGAARRPDRPSCTRLQLSRATEDCDRKPLRDMVLPHPRRHSIL